MKRIFTVVISVLMIVTGFFSVAPEVSRIAPSVEIEASAASYPSLKPINYKATGNKRQDMVGFAKTQIGYAEKRSNNTYFGAWYGMNGQPWCAMFICWCAAKSGVPATIIPRLANADRSWAKKQGVYHKSKQWGENYIPQPGDLIYFSWSVRDYADHIGMVSGTGVQNGIRYVYTIEGNKHDKVTTGSYPINNKYILGYASPDYTGKGVTSTKPASYTIRYDANGGSNAPAAQTKQPNKDLILQKGVPVRAGFTFLGWAQIPNAKAAQCSPGTVYKANKSTTFYAVWKDNRYVVKPKVDVTMRLGPGLNYGYNGMLKKGTSATVIETRNGWCKLANGRWIMEKLTTRISGAPAPTTTTRPATTTNRTTGTSTGSLGIYEATGDIYKRSGPGTGYAQRGVLKKGARFNVMQIKNGWARLSDGTWSSMKYMKKISSAASTSRTTTNTTKAPSASTTRPSTGSLGIYEATGDIYKRSGPGTGYAQKGVLKKGARFNVMQIKNGWARLSDGTWSSMKYMKKISSTALTSQSVTTTTTTATSAPAASVKEFVARVRVSDGLYMRSAPGTSGAVRGTLAKNKTFTVKAVSGGWGQLKSNNTWVLLTHADIVSGYRIKISISSLQMRMGPGTEYSSVGAAKVGTNEIVQLSEDGAWGRLKDTRKWVMLRYTTRI